MMTIIIIGLPFFVWGASSLTADNVLEAALTVETVSVPEMVTVTAVVPVLDVMVTEELVVVTELVFAVVDLAPEEVVAAADVEF